MQETIKAMRRSTQAGLRGMEVGALRLAVRAKTAVARVRDEECAQGTTEYAILVGVLVVIAILAIVAFRQNLSDLWDDITDGINSL